MLYVYKLVGGGGAANVGVCVFCFLCYTCLSNCVNDAFRLTENVLDEELKGMKKIRTIMCIW